MARARLIRRGIPLKYQKKSFPPRVFWEGKPGGCFDSIGQRSISCDYTQKALVFCAAALKGVYLFYDHSISDSAFALGIEFFNV
jgi:hypothetical protein